MILTPSRTRFNTVGSPSMLPNTFTALAARISFPLLAGVRPKKRHSAEPGGQYATAPISTTALEPGSSSACTGMPK